MFILRTIANRFIKRMKDDLQTGCQCPSRCFCKYQVGDLEEIGRRKLIANVPTVELMKSASSDREKDLICVISMLDVDEAIADIMIREHMADAACDVLACRESLKRRLYRRLKII